MEVTRYDGRLWDGYVFLTPSDQKTKRGTYELSGTGFIMTTDGDLVFAGEENGYNFCDEWVAGMTDFRKQEYKGRPYITYWNGCNTQGAHWGHRWGRVTFIDEEYTNFTINPDMNINTLDDANKGQIDVHEHQMTDRNSMVVSSYNNTQVNLTSIGGAEDGWIAESMFFEIDVETQEVLFEWRAADHIPFRDSRWPLRGRMGQRHFPWDWFHINSVQRVGENYLISSRHLWAVFLISGKDGSVIWKLDGEHGGSFGSIPSRFRWQHHARAQNVTEHGMTISVFNNHVSGRPTPETQTQGLALWVPLPASRKNPPQLVRKLQTDSNRVFSATQGSYTVDLGNGNGFIGYGKIPLAREYGPAGDGSDLRWQARFGKNDAAMSYRAFKATWHGTPKNWDPIAAFEKVRLQQRRAPKVYVSWNGATDISAWAVFAGDDKESLKSVGIAKKKGFETVFDLENAKCVQLGAIRDGEVIRASNVACIEEVEDDVSTSVDDSMFDSPTGDEVDDSHTEGDLEDYPTEGEIEELEAEKEELEGKLEQLEAELEEMESGAWFSYRLFAEVACAVVLAVAATWGYILWRDWRSRRYQSLDTYTQPRLIPGFGRGVFSRNKRNDPNRSAESAAEFCDTPAPRRGRGGGNYELSGSEEDDDSSGTTARTPFMRQTSGV